MYGTIRGMAMVAAVAFAGSLAADDKEVGKPKADPAGTPLELSISGKTVKYTLDTGELTPEAYKKKLEEALKIGGRPPAAPAVDLTVDIKNTSDQPVKVWTKGDPVVLDLALKGKGAVNAEPRLAFTREFRNPTAVEIAPGKSHAIPVKALTSGFRGMSKYAYWTVPGEHELVATLRTGVQPAPKGAKEGMNGFGVVTLTSAPLKITVEGKK